MEDAQRLIKHPTGELWIPMVYGTEDDKHSSSINDVMEMGYHKISIMNMDIKWHLGKRYTSNTSKHKINNESTGK